MINYAESLFTVVKFMLAQLPERASFASRVILRSPALELLLQMFMKLRRGWSRGCVTLWCLSILRMAVRRQVVSTGIPVMNERTGD